MTFLAPGFLYAALAAAVAIVALHLIVTHRPRAAMLPTARFVPDVAAAATSRVVRPSDLLLLLVRVFLLLAVGAALARPVLKPHRERIARVIVADHSASVASVAEVNDSVHALFRPGDVVVSFDSAAHGKLTSDSLSLPDSIAIARSGSAHAATRTPARGSLSAALVAALRATPSVRNGADSIELVLVSPLTVSEIDRATPTVRALWPGRARLVRVAADTTSDTRQPHISWTTTERPPLAVARPQSDTTGAVIAGSDVVIAPFQRRWTFPSDSLVGAEVVARWVDGTAAAVERMDDAGCDRSIAIPVDSAGDLMLRSEFIRVREALTGACRSVPTAELASDSLVRLLAGTGKLASAAVFPAPTDVHSTLAPWLMGAGLALALIELLVRYRRGER